MNEKNIKVLIVDDFATMRKVIRNLLKQVGYEDIVEAEDGVMALKALKAQKIDVIVSDWNMPNMTGLDLLKSIRAHERLKDIPVLLVTAEAEKENVVQAAQAGVNDYIVKPFTADVLQKKNDRIFG